MAPGAVVHVQRAARKAEAIAMICLAMIRKNNAHPLDQIVITRDRTTVHQFVCVLRRLALPCGYIIESSGDDSVVRIRYSPKPQHEYTVHVFGLDTCWEIADIHAYYVYLDDVSPFVDSVVSHIFRMLERPHVRVVCVMTPSPEMDTLIKERNKWTVGRPLFRIVDSRKEMRT